MANSYREDNSGIHIERIILIKACTYHKADLGEPCWNIYSDHGPLRGICDQRARKAGAEGKITPYQKAFSPRSKKDNR